MANQYSGTILEFKDLLEKNKLFSYPSYRNQLCPRYGILWGNLILAYLFLMGMFIITSRIRPNNEIFLFISSVIITAILIGFVIYEFALILHAASHFNLLKNKVHNDILTNIFVAIFFGQSVEVYRQIHFRHHKYLGTDLDPENSYRIKLDMVFIFKSITGLHFLTKFFFKNKNSEFNHFIFLTIAINVFILSFSAYFKNWIFFLSWPIAVTIFFPFFSDLRLIVEHRSTSDSGVCVTKYFPNKFSCIFGASGFNFHLLHHWDPSLHFSNLREATAELINQKIFTDSPCKYSSEIKILLRK